MKCIIQPHTFTSRFYTGVVLLFLLFAGCSKTGGDTNAEPTNWQDGVEPFDPSALTTEMMLEDYDYFWEHLEENCPLLQGIAREEGVPVAEEKAKVRKKVELLQDGDAEGFTNVLNYMQTFFHSRGHIGNIGANTYNAVMEKHTAQPSVMDVYDNPKSRAYYKWEITLPKFQSIMRSQNQEEQAENLEDKNRVESDAETFVNENLKMWEQGGVPILEIKTFAFGAHSEAAEQLAIQGIQNFCLEHLDATDMMIDIRGNSGGVSKVWAEGLKPLFAGHILERKTMAAFQNSAYNREIWGDWPQSDEHATIQSIDALAGMDLKKLVMEDLSGVESFVCQNYIQDYSEETNPNGLAFKGHIWLLIDQASFSASEELIQNLKDNDFVTLVGTRTGGNGIIITSPAMVPFALPNTGIICQYDAFYTLNSDGSCNSLEGTPPDVEIKQGEDAMQVALEIINNKK